MSEQTFYGFRDGLPTGPDVTRIERAYPELRTGERIEYSVIAELIGAPYPSARFRSVTDAWRKKAFAQGLVIGCIPRTAFLVLTDEQISAGTYGVFEHIGRSARRQRCKLATIQAENDAMKATVVHQQRLLSATEIDARKARMNLLPNTAVAPMPSIRPPHAERAAQGEA